MNNPTRCAAIAAPIAVIFLLLSPARAADDLREIQELKSQLARQQQQIDELRQLLVNQQKQIESIRMGAAEAVAPEPVFRPAVQVTPASPAAPADSGLQKSIESINSNLRGFRFSGDFRYRLDLQLRSANDTLGPLQNARSRYRLRLNIDKDLAAGLTSHLQLSTGPYATETTNDQDMAGIAVKHPFSIAEAWIRYNRKNLTIRGGRMDEVFADNMRFLWDDDIRFNGFEADYRVPLSGILTGLEFRAADYILSNPNTPIVPSGSPYLSIGYKAGQKVRDATLFHPGVILRGKGAKGWTWQAYSTLSWYRNADQIQLASTAAGFPALVSPADGLALSGPIGASGNAVTTPGGAMFAARHWQIAHLGFRTDYAESKLGKRSMPLWFDFQGSMNTGTGAERNAYLATANWGNVRQFGDLRFLYQFSHKEANSIISHFTDDDLGTGTGVNTRVHAIRLDVGLTRFLQWQNLLFIQDPIAGNHAGFFVNLPRGANTTYRYLGQLAFGF